MTSIALTRIAPVGLTIAFALCMTSPGLAQGRPVETLTPKQATAAQAARGPAMGPPTAVIKVVGGWVIQVDSTARFDGTGSTSVPPGHVLKYQWEFGDGTTASGATVTHKYNSAGEPCSRVNAGAPPLNPLLVKLVVTDAATPSAPATYRVRVCSGALNPNYPGKQP